MTRDDVIRRELTRVQRGVKARSTGIRRCPACREPYILDIPAKTMPVCPECRPANLFTCRQCRTKFHGTRAGDLLCPCCRVQPPLFEVTE